LSSMLAVFYSITLYRMVKMDVYNKLTLVCFFLVASNVLWLFCDSFDYYDRSLAGVTSQNSEILVT